MVTKAERDPGSVLFGAARRAVLGLLLERPEERFHLRQIVRLTGLGIGPVQRELAKLTRAGIVCRQQSGRQVYFEANRASPIFEQLKALFLRIAGPAAVLRQSMAPLSDQIVTAVIFGSWAAGRVSPTSDIDLLVVSETLKVRDLSRSVRETSSRLGRDVNVNLYRPSEWAQRAARRHPLVRSILNGPRLPVLGDPHELERLADQRVA